MLCDGKYNRKDTCFPRAFASNSKLRLVRPGKVDRVMLRTRVQFVLGKLVHCTPFRHDPTPTSIFECGAWGGEAMQRNCLTRDGCDSCAIPRSRTWLTVWCGAGLIQIPVGLHRRLYCTHGPLGRHRGPLSCCCFEADVADGSEGSWRCLSCLQAPLCAQLLPVCAGIATSSEPAVVGSCIELCARVHTTKAAWVMQSRASPRGVNL